MSQQNLLVAVAAGLVVLVALGDAQLAALQQSCGPRLAGDGATPVPSMPQTGVPTLFDAAPTSGAFDESTVVVRRHLG